MLDAFANRIGDNTWQTVITQERLVTVKKILRQTASKNTAVSCHWIRSRSRSDLVWVVGNRQKFNREGVVPVNRTTRNLMYAHTENDWTYLPLIKALVAIAALLHDWGKASQLFQEKLNPKNKVGFKGDPIRHEWVSCLLLDALIQIHQDNSDQMDDRGWIEALISGDIDEAKIKALTIKQKIKPLADLPPIAKFVAWLIVSHHRLPLNKDADMRAEYCPEIDDVLNRITQRWGYENNYDELDYQQRVEQCFNFPNGLLSNSKSWMKQIQKWSQRLLTCEGQALQSLSDGSYRSVLSYARLCLMLGDHYYSSQGADEKWKNISGLFANTDFKTKALKQKLDEHLVGVAKHGLNTAHLLPAFESEPPIAQDIVALKKPCLKEFRWQDKAVEKIKLWRKDNTKKQGFFAVNMASTGCGKTFANAKVMQALSADGNSLRFILALGLRTLTL
nr:HD domain-containing protein [Coxiella burnetii]